MTGEQHSLLDEMEEEEADYWDAYNCRSQALRQATRLVSAIYGVCSTPLKVYAPGAFEAASDATLLMAKRFEEYLRGE